MKLFLNNINDAINYTLSDKTLILIISALMAIASLINKNDFIHPFYRIINIALIIVMGYGSFVSWYTFMVWISIRSSGATYGNCSRKALKRQSSLQSIR